MLKKIRVLFLGLIVLAGSACVTPTHASSASPVILTYIQAAGPGGAKAEAIAIYNTTNSAIDITGWCIGNKTPKIFACFSEEEVHGGVNRTFLPAYGYATMASREYSENLSLDEAAASVTFDSLNQSSGTIVASGDSISLFNESGEVVDSYIWTGTSSSSKAWARMLLFSAPDAYAMNNNIADWAQVAWRPLPVASTEMRFFELPDSEDKEEENSESEEPSISLAPLIITEIFANAAGADVGKEFIEIFNPNAREAVSFDGLRLSIGIETTKWYDLPANMVIPPLSYMSFSDSDLGFTLANMKGGVQLFRGDEPIGERVVYESAKDDMSWALINDAWQYTNRATPGAENIPTPKVSIETETGATTSKKPCAANQFRNPETGRCKLLSSGAAAPTPCKPGQERNPETNRCRTIAAASTPTPCKEGQERNPETNRCRNVTKMSTVGHGVKGVQTKPDAQPSWYYWAGIAGIVLLISGYGVWEWREELRHLWRRMKAPFAKQ